MPDRRPVKIIGCRPIEEPEDSGSGPAAGVVVSRSEGLRVACGNRTVLEIMAIQKPGRRELSGEEFANGERLTAGERFV